MNLHKQKLLLWSLALSFIFILSALWYAVILSTQSLNALKALEPQTASAKARSALLVVRPLSWLTLRLSPDIETWREALTLASESDHLAASATLAGQSLLQPSAEATQPAPLKDLTNQLQLITDRLTSLEQHCQGSLVIKYLADCQNVSQGKTMATDWLAFNRWLAEENPTLIVLFQNTEELRASGGFMGSYAKVAFRNGAISELLIEDIYEPDGQFTGFVEAPVGVKDYLSSGQGLRLPDANWHPDFPTSAQTILTYFALGKERAVDGLVAINSDLIERLLKVTGEIFLPDYGVTVTSENFTTLARADRDQFFPGSQQKTNFLSHFFTVFKVKLAELNPEQQLALAQVLRAASNDKTIQLYSTQADIQALATKYQLSGAVTSLTHPTDPVFYLVESNVGINKANRAIERTVKLQLLPDRLLVKIDFSNQNSGLGYLNYQRLLVPPAWVVAGGSQLKFDQEIITNSQGQQFNQIGFLVTVPAQTSATVELALTIPPGPPTGSSLTILKQPGLPPTPYTVSLDERTDTFILEKDTLLTL